MIYTIPFVDLPSFTEEITFGDTPYILTFNWNNRGEFWTLDIADREQNDLLTGMKLTNQNEIFRLFSTENLPRGSLYIVDNRNKFDNIEYDSFINGNCSLVFEDDE